MKIIAFSVTFILLHLSLITYGKSDEVSVSLVVEAYSREFQLIKNKEDYQISVNSEQGKRIRAIAKNKARDIQKVAARLFFAQKLKNYSEASCVTFAKLYMYHETVVICKRDPALSGRALNLLDLFKDHEKNPL